MSASDHEVREQPIQPRGWPGLVKELRSSRRTLQHGNRANCTTSLLQNVPGESNRKNSSPTCGPSIDATRRWAAESRGILNADFFSNLKSQMSNHRNIAALSTGLHTRDSRCAPRIPAGRDRVAGTHALSLRYSMHTD